MNWPKYNESAGPRSPAERTIFAVALFLIVGLPFFDSAPLGLKLPEWLSLALGLLGFFLLGVTLVLERKRRFGPPR